MSEWQLEPPDADPDDFLLSPENVKILRDAYDAECAGMWRDIEREVICDPAQLDELLSGGEPLNLLIRIDFSGITSRVSTTDP